MKKTYVFRTFFLILFAGIVYACVETDVFDTISGKRESKEVSAARTWVENCVGELTMERLSVVDATGAKERRLVAPNWQKTVSASDNEYSYVEAKLDGEEQFGFVSAECMAKFEETGDRRYLENLVRLVVRTNRKTGATDACIMAAYPHSDFIDAGGSMKNFSYIDRPANFSGVVFYHHLSGEFANGWIYKEGVEREMQMPVAVGTAPVQLRSSTSSDNCCTPVYQYDIYYTDWYTNDRYTGTNIQVIYASIVDWVGTCCNSSGGGNSNSNSNSNNNGGGSGGGGYSGWGSDSSKIFDTRGLSFNEWIKLEEMIDKIMSDCMGKALYNALTAAMGMNRMWFDCNYSPPHPRGR